jgi:elongation factor Ts
MSVEITPQKIKELRGRTGVGVSKCKEALAEASGDIEEAINYLRKTGLASAVKKAGREANEGKIVTAQTDDCVALVEIGAETDFVANNEQFVEFAKNVAEEAAKTKPSSVEEFSAAKFSKDPSMTIEEYRGTLVQAIGENIQIKRLMVFDKESKKSIGIYSHMGGKIVTVVEMIGGSEELAKDVAMHAAAAAPDFLSPDTVPDSIIEQEKDVARGQLAGKPEHIMDKILDGKINAFYDDVCLLRQKYIKDDSMSVADYVKSKNADAAVTNFVRWSVGE